MIDVLVAEDEFGAREQIKLLVGRFQEFRLVGEADNGDSALELLGKLQPDLILTDIRMPGKNGLDLLRKAAEVSPGTEGVIISGYSDFEYAQSAIQLGCRDYILKPISPKKFQSMMEKMEERILERQSEERAALFKNIVLDRECDKRLLEKYFPFGKYHLSLLRELGLPGSAGREGDGQLISEMGEWNCIYGRDGQEALYLWPAETFSVQDFEKKQKEKMKGKDTYCTMLSYTDGILVEEIPQCVRRLYNALDRKLVIGKNQVLRMEFLSQKKNEKKIDLKPLEHFVQKKDWEVVKKELYNLLDACQEQEIPLNEIQNDMSFLLADLSRKMKCDTDSRYYMEEIYGKSRNMDDLKKALLDFIYETFSGKEEQKDKVDTAEFFDSVLDYIRQNASRSITLQEICEKFHVSLSYMSRMFKKYTGKGFNEYLTKLRIEEACRLFQENRQYYIKDVANMVGIPDQFYFSRLFRSVTGKTPSRYVKELSN